MERRREGERRKFFDFIGETSEKKEPISIALSSNEIFSKKTRYILSLTKVNNSSGQKSNSE